MVVKNILSSKPILFMAKICSLVYLDIIISLIPKKTIEYLFQILEPVMLQYLSVHHCS